MISHGSKVKCMTGNIDNGRGAGAIGYVHGFARLSKYHAREVYVSDTPEGTPRADWCGWFWESSVEEVASTIEPAKALEIAKASLPGIETLETRGRDCLDFHDVSVASLRRIIEAAYAAGVADREGR